MISTELDYLHMLSVKSFSKMDFVTLIIYLQLLSFGHCTYTLASCYL